VKDGPRPFKANLDVGLVRTTTGHRVFAALKGAVDGGINVPHNEKRFFGFSKEDKKLDANLLRKAVFGGHVSEYMRKLADDEPARYQKQFARFIKGGVTPDKIEGMYKKAHQAIRANPDRAADPNAKTHEQYKADSAKYRPHKLTLAQRKQRIADKKAKIIESVAHAGDDDEQVDDE